MKLSKIYAFVPFFAALCSVSAQEGAASAPSAPASEPSVSAQGSAPASSQDRSYVEDFINKDADLFWVDSSSGRENKVRFKSADSSKLILVDVSGGGEISVPKGASNFKFFLKGGDNWNRARYAYGRGNWDEAITYLRPMVYPVIGMACLPKENFNAHAHIETLISSLANAGRYKELSALLGALPLSECPQSLIEVACAAGKELVANGYADDVVQVLDRFSFDSSNMDSVSDIMDLLSSLRKAGKLKECLVAYTKLGNVEGNPDKNAALIWMSYCDLALGNRMSAEVYLSGMKLERSDVNFSLLQMVKGMLKASGEKPDYSVALDMFAEGIVYGSPSNPWMSELMFNAGCAYKKLKQFTAANEIFAQISSFWPGDSFSEKAKKEIVPIKKKDEKTDNRE